VLLLPIELNDLLGILLLFGLATLLKEGVLEAIINGQSKVGVEHQDFMEKINGFFSCTRINCG